jgi:hypothetical protein
MPNQWYAGETGNIRVFSKKTFQKVPARFPMTLHQQLCDEFVIACTDAGINLWYNGDEFSLDKEMQEQLLTFLCPGCISHSPAPSGQEILCDPTLPDGAPTHHCAAICKECKSENCCVLWDCPQNTEIRNDERKKVLDELMSFILLQMECGDGETISSGKIQIAGMIAELRKQGEQE